MVRAQSNKTQLRQTVAPGRTVVYVGAGEVGWHGLSGDILLRLFKFGAPKQTVPPLMRILARVPSSGISTP